MSLVRLDSPAAQELVLARARINLFPPMLAASKDKNETWLAFDPPHAKQVQNVRLVNAAAEAELALWRLARAGLAATTQLLWTRQGRIVLPPGCLTAANRAPESASIRRRLGSREAALAALTGSLELLPAAQVLASQLGSVIDAALSRGLPQVVAVPDLEQAQAVNALILSAGVSRVPVVSAVPWVRADLRLLGPAPALALERALERIHDTPTVVVATSTLNECERTLSHLAEVNALPTLQRADYLQWLEPLGIDAADALDELVPLIEHEPDRARQMVLTLIERSGAQWRDERPALAPRWRDELRNMAQARDAYVPPQASRLARLLAASPEGLSANAIEQSPQLASQARSLLALGTIERHGEKLQAAPNPRPATRLVDECLWLAERPHFAPLQAARDAWVITRRLRAGDLAAFDDALGISLLKSLTSAGHFESAAAMLEAHALAASRRRAGPPGVELLLAARDLGLLLWPPRRQRRMFRLWLRGYFGPWRALLLALLAQTQRSIGGPGAYGQTLQLALDAASKVTRLAKEQALLECALCCAADDPQQARLLLDRVGSPPAQSANLLSTARGLMARAVAEFVSIRIAPAIDLLRQAREALSRRAPPFLLRRMSAEIESLSAMYVSVLSGGRQSALELLAPLQQSDGGQGGISDLIARVVVNDRLFLARRLEVGIIEPRELETVLAHARPHNRRGYMVLLNQLCENAVYRMEFQHFAPLGARIEAMLRQGVVDHVVDAAYRRHRALMLVAEGRLGEAVKIWRSARGYRAPAPWNRRSAYMRHGEWGLVLMAAGKFKSAARTFMRSCDEFRRMDVRNRIAVFAPLAAICILLSGECPSSELVELLRVLCRDDYVFTALFTSLVDAASGRIPFSEALAAIARVKAPAGWRALALTLGAALARQTASGSAAQWASRARATCADWPIIGRFLEHLFPTASRDRVELSPRLYAAMAALHCPPQSPPSIEQLMQGAAQAALSALGARSAVVCQAGLAPAYAGDANEALQSLAQSVVAPVIDGNCIVVPLASGAIAAARLNRAATPGDLADLAALAARLEEMLALVHALNQEEVSRRKMASLSEAAWSLAQNDRALGARLSTLAEVVAADCGATRCTLELLRNGRLLAASGQSSGDWQSTAEIGSGAAVRLWAVNGSSLALSRALAKAARVISQWLNAPQQRQALMGENEGDDVQLAGEPVGVSAVARAFAQELKRFAGLDLTVIITGEAGAGKDFAARALHAHSRRASAPHIVVDCAALRPETAASELFGHVRGSFTGATSDSVGLLARATGGTLQFDNMAELSPELQAMLLRALEARQVTPIGSGSPVAFDVRLVVTSPLPLDALVRSGRLRHDLSQRLAGLSLVVPPLRGRAADIAALARHFLESQCSALGRRLHLTRQAIDTLCAHEWPGNVRELRSAIARAAALCDTGGIGPADLALGEGKAALRIALPDLPRLNATARVLLGLAQAQGELTPRDAAAKLGISRTAASLHLTALAKADLLQREGNGRSTKYVAAK